MSDVRWAAYSTDLDNRRALAEQLGTSLVLLWPPDESQEHGEQAVQWLIDKQFFFQAGNGFLVDLTGPSKGFEPISFMLGAIRNLVQSPLVRVVVVGQLDFDSIPTTDSRERETLREAVENGRCRGYDTFSDYVLAK